MLIDVGPNLGAINRAAMIAANFVAVPLAPDLFSLQGLRNLGPILRDWRREWGDRVRRRPSDADLSLPAAEIHPVGYIVMLMDPSSRSECGDAGVTDRRTVPAVPTGESELTGGWRFDMTMRTMAIGSWGG